MSIMETFGYPSAAAAKSALLDEVLKAGAVRLEAHYSGGNDEGGVDTIELFDVKGKKMEAPEAWIERKPTADDAPYRIRDGVVHDYHPLYEAADNMLATEFGSWAGDFTAYGVLHADVTTGKVTRSGEMSSYNPDEMDY